jgi:membrane fusion protein (multidrug efflux system)
MLRRDLPCQPCRRHDIRQIAIVAGLAAALVACGGATPTGGPSGTATAAAPGAPTSDRRPGGPPGGISAIGVMTAKVTAQDFVDRFTALATATAAESIDVTSRISSVVTRINFREGQEVTTGQLLVELDSQEIRADLALAEASLQQARSQFERSRSLAAARIISETQMEELEAKMKIAEAQVQAAQARLEHAFIRAPFAGTVGLRRVSPGDLVGPDTVITTLDDTRTIRLEFKVPETFLATLGVGMTIDALSTVYPGRPFSGTVASLDSRVDPVTRAVTVIATVANAERLLKPGMFLTANLERARRDVLLVPEEALTPRQGRQFVFLVQDGRAVEREVEIGSRSPGLAEVRNGLVAGDVVVTEGTQRLRDGMPVQSLSSG